MNPNIHLLDMCLRSMQVSARESAARVGVALVCVDLAGQICNIKLKFPRGLTRRSRRQMFSSLYGAKEAYKAVMKSDMHDEFYICACGLL